MDSSKRIDKGIPRPKVDRTPKAVSTGIVVRKTQAERMVIIEDTYKRLEDGESTDSIGASHGVPGSTLRFWLLDDPKATKARLSLVNGELVRTMTDMKEAADPLALARAREEFRAWSYVAERRHPDLYGQKQEVTHKVPEPLKIVVSAQQDSSRIIEGTATVLEVERK